MSIQTDTQEPIRRALLDVVQSLRGLVARTKGICELGSHSGRPMDPLVQRSRQLLEALEDATEIMALFGDEEVSLQIDREKNVTGNQKVVVRCVNTVLDALSSGEDHYQGADTDRVDLRGISWSIGIPDLLGFLETIKKTGTVNVTTFEETFTVVLQDGHVVHAASSASPHGLRLGDILVKQGATTHAELQEFLRRHSAADGSIGAAVVNEGIVTREQLEAALEYQVQQLFHRLYAAEDATFSFHDGRSNSNQHKVDMNLTGLLLESALEAEVAEERKRA